MIETIGIKDVVTRKNHVCFGCGRDFLPGSKMERSGVADSGTMWTCYLCETCAEISRGLDDYYGFGDLRQAALEMEKGGGVG